MSTSNNKKSELLGVPFGTASGRLRKLILFDFVQLLSLDSCYKCNETIKFIEDLSIEHIEPWQSSDDPKESFFDLGNIAFSHLSCNVGYNRDKTHCKSGHKFNESNTRYSSKNGKTVRDCKPCDARWSLNYYHKKKKEYSPIV